MGAEKSDGIFVCSLKNKKQQKTEKIIEWNDNTTSANLMARKEICLRRKSANAVTNVAKRDIIAIAAVDVVVGVEPLPLALQEIVLL